MSHFHIDVIVSKEDLQILREQFPTYVKDSGGLSIGILSDNEEVEPSEELQEVIKKMFYSLLMTMIVGEFRGVQ